MLSLAHFLLIGAVLFCLSVAGIFINRKKRYRAIDVR